MSDDTTSFVWLENLLRAEGLIVGPLSDSDEQAIDRLLKDIRNRFRNGN